MTYSWRLFLGGIRLKTPIFQGAATAIVTPFQEHALDLAAFRRLLDFQAEGGISAIVVCGTTGECATLADSEKRELYAACIEHCAGRMKVICGVGSNDSAHALSLAKQAQQLGADGVMVVTPYYNKTNQYGLIKHFFHVAEGIDIPLIVYNVPSRTGIAIQPETYIELATHPNINGVKEASGNIGEFGRVKALCGDGLNFWSGNDGDTVAMMALGAQGVISVASNLLPDAVSLLCRLCLTGEFRQAASLNEKFSEVFYNLFIDVNPIPIKTALASLGFCSPELRLPLAEMNIEKRNALIKSINNLQFS